MYFPSTTEILDVLDYEVDSKLGKTAPEIRTAIAEKQEVSIGGVVLGTIHGNLHDLVMKGIAIDREREISAEQLAIRGNRPAYEYFLAPK